MIKQLADLIAFKSRTQGAKDKKPRKRRGNFAGYSITDIERAKANMRQRGIVVTPQTLAVELGAHRGKSRFQSFGRINSMSAALQSNREHAADWHKAGQMPDI